MQLTRLTWLGLLALAFGEPQGYYGYGGYPFPSLKPIGTGTSPPTLSTGATGTDPVTIVPPTSAPYGNSSSSSYFPSGIAPFSTGIPGTSADPSTTPVSGSPTPSANATSYGTVSGAPYKTYNASVSAYPTDGPTHGPYPPPSGTISTAVSTKLSGNATVIASTGDPSAKPTAASGTAASTGLASAPSSFGKLTYTAPTGIPSEYFYHHRKPKRNVPRGDFAHQG